MEMLLIIIELKIFTI